jgi:uncharacterized protein (TIRG00374 family)
MTKGKLIINWVCIAVAIPAMAIIILKTDISRFKAAMSGLSYIWLTSGAAAVILSWIFDALTLKKLLPGITGSRLTFAKSFKYSMAGLYYTALSPFGSAGQPMQMVYMANDGISVGKTTAAATMKFFTDKIAVGLMLSIFFIVSGAAFYKSNAGIFWFSLLAFAFNLALLAGVLLMITKPVFAERIFKGGVRILGKLKIMKHPEKAIGKIDTAIRDYSSAALFIKTNKLRTLLLSLLSLGRRLLLVIVPYFLYKAFGFSAVGMMEILSMNVFMSFAITLMPTPGGSLAAEGGFSAIFAGMFGAALIPAMVIWRLFTYYIIIAVGGVMVVGDNILKVSRNRRNLSKGLVTELPKTQKPVRHVI